MREREQLGIRVNNLGETNSDCMGLDEVTEKS